MKSHTGTSHRTAKALLGELYADKEYLEKLLKDDGKKIIKCLHYCKHDILLLNYTETVLYCYCTVLFTETLLFTETVLFKLS